MKTLHTATLTLEPQTRDHAEEMFVVLGDPAIYEFENEPPTSKLWLAERFAKLESRRSADGRERWLNWVICLPTGELAGYVQSTLTDTAEADIAYVLASAFWGQGIARAAVTTMLVELSTEYGTRDVFATLKTSNHRSLKLLKRLGFAPASAQQLYDHAIEADESLMYFNIDHAVVSPDVVVGDRAVGPNLGGANTPLWVTIALAMEARCFIIDQCLPQY